MFHRPQTISQRVRTLIIAELGVESSQVTPNARFIEDFGADALDAVELIMAIEEEFQVEISNAEADQLQTVQSLILFLERHRPH